MLHRHCTAPSGAILQAPQPAAAAYSAGRGMFYSIKQGMYRVPGIGQPYAQLNNGSHNAKNEHWRGLQPIGIK